MTKLEDAGIFATGASESTTEPEENQKSRGQPGRTRNKSKAEKVLEHLSAEGFERMVVNEEEILELDTEPG